MTKRRRIDDEVRWGDAADMTEDELMARGVRNAAENMRRLTNQDYGEGPRHRCTQCGRQWSNGKQPARCCNRAPSSGAN